MLNQTLKILIDNYRYYASWTSTSERSLLPIVGKALSVMFQTVSSTGLDIIQENVEQLANDHEEQHVVVKYDVNPHVGQ